MIYYTNPHSLPIPKAFKKKKAKSILFQIALEHGYSIVEIGIIFHTDESLLEINRAFLNHDYYTDIITFDNRDNKGIKSMEGELHISLERVKENAKKEKVKAEIELYRVVFHGLLHLVGYKDKTKEQAKTIRGKEDYYINLLS